MHWSRLVDLPLALAMTVGDLVGSPGFSNRFAMTIVPLATLLAVMAGVADVTRRLAGREEEQLALILTPLSIPLLYQLRPMRIDHHGWQVALAIAAMAALVGAATGRRGAFAGAMLAILVTISLEGLPIAVTITGVLALSWVVDPNRRFTLRAPARQLCERRRRAASGDARAGRAGRQLRCDLSGLARRALRRRHRHGHRDDRRAAVDHG